MPSDTGATSAQSSSRTAPGDPAERRITAWSSCNRGAAMLADGVDGNGRTEPSAERGTWAARGDATDRTSSAAIDSDGATLAMIVPPQSTPPPRGRAKHA